MNVYLPSGDECLARSQEHDPKLKNQSYQDNTPHGPPSMLHKRHLGLPVSSSNIPIDIDLLIESVKQRLSSPGSNRFQKLYF